MLANFYVGWKEYTVHVGRGGPGGKLWHPSPPPPSPKTVFNNAKRLQHVAVIVNVI